MGSCYVIFETLGAHLIHIMLCNMISSYILSIYSPFSDRVGRPFHNTLSLFFPFVDIISVDLKFCHIRFYTLYPCPYWSSNRSSVFNSIHLFTHSSSLSSSHVNTISAYHLQPTFSIIHLSFCLSWKHHASI